MEEQAGFGAELSTISNSFALYCLIMKQPTARIGFLVGLSPILEQQRKFSPSSVPLRPLKSVFRCPLDRLFSSLSPLTRKRFPATLLAALLGPLSTPSESCCCWTKTGLERGLGWALSGLPSFLQGHSRDQWGLQRRIAPGGLPVLCKLQKYLATSK